MKDLINSLYWDAKHDLDLMRKTDMKLSERLKYDRALLRLEIMKRLMEKELK